MTTPVRGFTLIEILVVVVILGVLASVLVLSIAGSSERRLERDAQRLNALIGYACEQAELSGSEIGLSFDTAGYRFGRLDRDTWEVFADGELRPRPWSGSVRGLLVRDGHDVEIAAQFPVKPQLLCFSSGELTPFALDLSLADAQTHYQLNGHPDGTLALVAVNPHAR